MKYENALCFFDMISLKNENLSKKFQGENINISCLNDKNFNAKFYKCEIASLSFVLALICKMSKDEKFQELDEGYLSAECCFGEEEAKEVLEFLQKAEFLFVDESINFHKDSQNIKYFLNFLSKKFKLKILNENEEELHFENAEFSELKELDNYDGLVLFKTKLKDKNLHCSKQFLQLSKCQNKSKVKIIAKEFELEGTLFLDESLQGTIGFLDCENKGFSFAKICIKEINAN